jgi:hypothetical protein
MAGFRLTHRLVFAAANGRFGAGRTVQNAKLNDREGSRAEIQTAALLSIVGFREYQRHYG